MADFYPSNRDDFYPSNRDDFYPSNRDDFLKSSHRWLRAKIKDDDCGGLWRVGDQLYDLSKFEKIHPGGAEWISMTKGTDITEAFETMHALGVPVSTLSKYLVKQATSPRNYRHTFAEDGFYGQLKRRAAKVLVQTGTAPDWRSKLTQDILTVCFCLGFGVCCWAPSWPAIGLTGLLLGLQTSCAHNWFHLRDSQAWRRYFFDLSLLSHRDWRISHALSHHLHTNTYTDVEVTAVEPYMSFLPQEKNVFVRRMSPFLLHLFAFIAGHVEFAKRVLFLVTREQNFHIENLFPVLEFSFLWFSLDILAALRIWFIIHGISGYWLIMTSVTTTHHHPELFHPGDSPRVDPDWGLHQLDTVRDLDKPYLPLVLTTFGDHLLHHLFPAVDHSKLAGLYPALHQTLLQFGEVYPTRTLADMLQGINQQLTNTKPKKL